MPVKDADPEAVQLDKLLGEAMDGTSKPRVDAKTPPAVDHEAPHGRDENGEPLAPYGWTTEKGKTPRPRLSNRGRPASSGTARTARPGDQDKARPAEWKPSGKSYLAELSSLGDAAWFGLSALGQMGGSVPVVGKLIPEEKVAAQAFVLSECKPRLAAAVNLAAQHNQKAEKFCQSLEGGNGLWALQCMFMILPVASLSAAVWKGDKALAEVTDDAEMTLKQLAAKNKNRMDEFMATIAAQMKTAAEEAMATPGEVVPDGA